MSEQPVSEQPVSEHRTAGDQGQTAARGGATGRGAGGSQEPVERLPWQEDAGTPEKPDGEASGYTCPECHGSLWEMGSRNGAPVEFECRVGHRYSLEAMLAAQAREIEAAIWSAVNTLEERASILRKQATRSRAAGTVHMADRFDAQAEEAAQHSETIRRTLLTLVQATTPGPGEPSEDDGLGEARAASD